MSDDDTAVAVDDRGLPLLHVGDHVADREKLTDDDIDHPDEVATMLVVEVTGRKADAYPVGGGETVADVNPDHPPDDWVYNVVFPQRTDDRLQGKNEYAYPRSRLIVRETIHDREDGTDDVQTDGGRESCPQCGLEGFGPWIACPRCGYDPDPDGGGR